MRPDQDGSGSSNPSFDDPLFQALQELDPATSDTAPVLGSDRHLTILEHAMSTPTGNTDPGGARITPLPHGSRPDPDATDLDAQSTYPSAPISGRRGPGRLAVGVAAILATVAGGFAFNTLTQPDGSTTPEAAVEALFDAIDDEDIIGVVEALEPNERKIVRPSLERLSEELERTGVVSGDLDLGGVEGIDITVDELDLRASYLGDDVATVQVVGGTIASSGNVDELPLGRVVKDLVTNDAQYDVMLDSNEPADLSGIQLVARRVDGSWHVSLLYTAAELIRTDMDPQPDPPSYGRGIAPRGADSPEAAVRELVDAGVAIDTRRMIELMPPGEGDVFHDYGPILIEEFADTDPVDFEIETLDLEVTERSGNTAEVAATQLRVHNTSGGDTYSVVYDGECTVTTLTYQWSSGYEDESGTYVEGPDEGSETESYDSCDPNSAMGGILLMPLLFDVGGITVHTVEHDGLWYVSPANTILDTVLDTFAEYDADQFEADIRAMNSPWLSYSDEYWTACGVERPAEDVDLDTGYQALEDCWNALPEDYAGSYHTGGGGPFGLFAFFAIGSMRMESSESYSSVGQAIEGGPYPGEECYVLDQATPESRDDVISCLEGLAAEGEVDPREVQGYRCSVVFDDLYGDGSGEPTLAEQEEADRAWQDCMGELVRPFEDGGGATQTTVVDPMPEGAGDGDSSGWDTTETTVVGSPVPTPAPVSPQN